MDFLKVSYKDMILNKVMTYSHTKKVYKNIKDLRLYLESAVHTFNHLKNNRHFIIKAESFRNDMEVSHYFELVYLMSVKDICEVYLNIYKADIVFELVRDPLNLDLMLRVLWILIKELRKNGLFFMKFGLIICLLR
jgi:hypothetical protein